jgi:outer membrane receptor protein involved in Fe transport
MAAFALAGGLFAQSKTSSALTGTVVDESGAAVPGAIVEASSPSQIGGARTATTDAQGRFRFAEIAPGIYSVSVNLEGFQPVRVEGVTLALGQTQDLRVDMKVATVTETLVVTADAAVIDTTSSQSTTTLDNDYLQNLPTVRFQPDVLNYAPGINDDNAYGAAGSGIAYQLDGVDTSDPEGGTAWSFVNYNIIEEVQLVGLGAPAEYGSFSGVVFNSITKSGGNEFKGLFDAYYLDDSLSDDISDEELAELDPRTEYFHDVTGQVGGPLAQDRVWFFLSGEDLKEETTFGGPVRTEHDPRAFGKLTWQVNESNLFNGWFEWDRYDIEGRGASATTPIEATVTEDAPEYVGNLSWQSNLSGNTILNVALGGYDGYYYLDPASGYDVAGHYDAFTGNYSVNSWYYYLADRTRNQLVASVSHFADDFIQGDHDFKFGMEIERSTLRSRFGYPGGEWIYDNYYYAYDDPGTPEYDGVYYSGVYRGYSYDLEGTIERASFFAQDSWKITPAFTVNAGVRYEINHGKVPGEGKIFDNDAIAPRLGFAWDMTNDGKTVLKGHWGRFYDKFVATQFYYAQPDAYTPLEFLIRYPSGYEVSFGQTAADTVVLDQELDSPYQDQWTIGIDRELPGGMTLSFTYINREKQDFIETVSRDGIFGPVNGQVGIQRDEDGNWITNGNTVTAYDYLNPEDDVLAYRNPEGLHRKYEGYMLVLNKRLRDNWQGMFSYVYSEATGNIDNNSFSGSLGADNAGSWLNTPNSLIFAEGKSTNDPTHQVKLQGTYIIPQINLRLSGNYTYYSGDTYTLRSSNVIVDGERYQFNQGSFLYFGEPRGSRRLDSKNELDVRAEWFFHPGSSDHEIGLFVDVFNVFNDARVTSVDTRAGAPFETPLTANAPRRYRLGVRYTF